MTQPFSPHGAKEKLSIWNSKQLDKAHAINANIEHLVIKRRRLEGIEMQASTKDLPFEDGHFIPYILSLPEVKSAWTRHTRHPFVLALGQGRLAKTAFQKYLIQDYHFLQHYARFVFILASRIPDSEDIFVQGRQAMACEEEMKVHIQYCKSFGLSIEDIMSTAEHSACLDYVKFLTRIAASDDWTSIQVALAPCGLGYRIVGEFLNSWNETEKTTNPYLSWIEYYSGGEYAPTVKSSLELLEKYVAREDPARIPHLVNVFVEAIELEVKFWDIGLEP